MSLFEQAYVDLVQQQSDYKKDKRIKELEEQLDMCKKLIHMLEQENKQLKKELDKRD